MKDHAVVTTLTPPNDRFKGVSDWSSEGSVFFRGDIQKGQNLFLSPQTYFF